MRNGHKADVPLKQKRNKEPRIILILLPLLLLSLQVGHAQPSLRQKIGQMVAVTFLGDSLEKSSASLDTLKVDLGIGNIGGIIMFTWSSNLRNPFQILHLTNELQRRSAVPLLIAIDEEGGQVARLGASNGFASTPSAFQLGTVINNEATTRSTAATMAGWFTQTGLNVDLAPVVDVNVNPKSPAIGALGRSFSADPMVVSNQSSWFIDEFHRKNILTTLKHFPGHGSAASDSHLGLTDVTTTWTDTELIPYRQLLNAGVVDLIMTAHVFNGKLDSLYPATLSRNILTGLLRTELGFHGVVVSDDMNMKAIVDYFGFDEAIVLAVNAGMDILLYTTNLDNSGNSLARHVINLVERKVNDGTIAASRVDESYNRIMALKQRVVTSVLPMSLASLPDQFDLGSYPNPFNASTTIAIRISERSQVKLKIFDMLGREIATLLNQDLPPGIQLVRWDASGLSSGIYIARLESGRTARSLKVVLLK